MNFFSFMDYSFFFTKHAAAGSEGTTIEGDDDEAAITVAGISGGADAGGASAAPTLETTLSMELQAMIGSMVCGDDVCPGGICAMEPEPLVVPAFETENDGDDAAAHELTPTDVGKSALNSVKTAHENTMEQQQENSFCKLHDEIKDEVRQQKQ